jgi:hypothetical protein
MIRSSSLDRFALEDSIEVYFLYFELHFVFYKFFKFIPIFWNTMKNQKSINPPHGVGTASDHESGTVGMAHTATRCSVARTGRARGAVTALSLRAHDGTVVASRRLGVPGEHQWGPGVASGKVEVDGAHPGSGSTARREKSGDSSMF